MNIRSIKDILFRYNNNLCNRLEIKAVEIWYERIQSVNEGSIMEEDISEVGDRIRMQLREHIGLDRARIRRVWRLAVASVAAGIFLFFLYNSPKDIQIPVIEAGKDQAVLILGNGHTVNLTAIPVGERMNLLGVNVTKSENGEISYELNEKTNKGEMNTLHVPKGGIFSVKLPDGSKVWLNSDSELRYPSIFSNATRQVHLKGEAYFEIARDEFRPFNVVTDRANIKVLGTKFNVKSYDNEEVLTTSVLDGKVRISNTNGHIVLNKNEYADVDYRGVMTLAKIETAVVSGWWQGRFIFDGATIGDIAKQMERWYNIDIEIDPKILNLEFYGNISKKETANEVFEILEATNMIKAKVFKDRIIITKK